MSASTELPMIDYRHRAATAWRQMLTSAEFTDFFTPTFGKPVSEELARRSVKNWIRRCNRSFYGRHWYRSAGNELTHAIAIELGERGHRHAHVLVRRPEGILSVDDLAWMSSIWSQKFGRIDHKSITDSRKAASYVTKTLWTDGEIEFRSKSVWGEK